MPEHGQPSRGHEPVVDLAVRAPETVCEVEEEAGETTESEEYEDHEGGDRSGAVAVAGDGGEEHLEGEEGAGREEVDEH